LLTQHGQSGQPKSVYVEVMSNQAPPPAPPAPPPAPPAPPPAPELTVTPIRIDLRETTRYATFTITGGVVGDVLDFKTSGTALSGFDYVSTLQFSLDGGSNWLFYNVTSKPDIIGSPILLRVAIINDTKGEPTESIIIEATATPSGATKIFEVYISD